MPIYEYPQWPHSRHLAPGFVAIPGDVESVSRHAQTTYSTWRWDVGVATPTRWRAMAHDAAGRCVKVDARAVIGMDLVRVQTTSCSK